MIFSEYSTCRINLQDAPVHYPCQRRFETVLSGHLDDAYWLTYKKIACRKETVISIKPGRIIVKGEYFVDTQD